MRTVSCYCSCWWSLCNFTFSWGKGTTEICPLNCSFASSFLYNSLYHCSVDWDFFCKVNSQFFSLLFPFWRTLLHITESRSKPHAVSGIIRCVWEISPFSYFRQLFSSLQKLGKRVVKGTNLSFWNPASNAFCGMLMEHCPFDLPNSFELALFFFLLLGCNHILIILRDFYFAFFPFALSFALTFMNWKCK